MLEAPPCHDLPWIIISLLYWLVVHQPLVVLSVMVVIGLVDLIVYQTLKAIVRGIIYLSQLVVKKIASSEGQQAARRRQHEVKQL